MKFHQIEKPKVSDMGYIRHYVDDLPNGELVQPCKHCGITVNDYRDQDKAITVAGEERHKFGMPKGYVYVSIGEPHFIVSEKLKEIGAQMPSNFTDCSLLNQ